MEINFNLSFDYFYFSLFSQNIGNTSFSIARVAAVWREIWNVRIVGDDFSYRWKLHEND